MLHPPLVLRAAVVSSAAARLGEETNGTAFSLWSRTHGFLCRPRGRAFATTLQAGRAGISRRLGPGVAAHSRALSGIVLTWTAPARSRADASGNT